VPQAPVELAALLLLAAAPLLHAHPGGVDESGGHRHRKTGTYHCHRSPCMEQMAAGTHWTQTGRPVDPVRTRKRRCCRPERTSSGSLGPSVPAPAKPRSHALRSKLPDTSRYHRRRWGGWRDLDGDCQDTREEILIRDNVGELTLSHDGCEVEAGLWVCPYTGREVTNPTEVDVDHLVPVHHAHSQGAQVWGQEQRVAFYNDPSNLLAVYQRANESKSNKGPLRWRPPIQDFWPTYAELWERVKSRYGLRSSRRERRRLEKMRTRASGD